MKPVLFIIFSSLFFLRFAGSVFAASLFTSSHAVSYAVAESGVTTVNQVVTLTNRVSHAYAKSYVLTITLKDIDNLKVVSGAAVLPTRVVPRDEVNSDIYIEFPESVVGFGKEQQFALTYQTRSIAHKNGRIWEVTIPGLIKTDDITAYTVTLITPLSFGAPAYQKPAPRNPSTGQTSGIWTLPDMQRGGIQMAFGDHQHAQFDLQYTITNTENTEVLRGIAIPPTVGTQLVSLDRIEPAPINVVADTDGNWLAQYLLKSDESLDIAVSGEVGIYLDQPPDTQEAVLDEAIKNRLTTPLQPYWVVPEQYRSGDIARLKTPRDIYDFTVGFLSYNYGREPEQITRLGAPDAFAQPDNALCMEFSDLFIALARDAGIPSRMVQGYAYSTNTTLQPLSLQTDVLHAWPQYYDENKRQWISIDPTWANTTGGIDYFSRLDFNHIIFSIFGTNHSAPAPAGAYRKDGRSKDVVVTFFEEPYVVRAPEIEVAFDEMEKNNGSFTTTATVTNVSKVLYQTDTVAVSSDRSNLNSTIPTSLIIPPLGYVEIPLSISQNTSETKPQITLTLGDQSFRTAQVKTSGASLTVWVLRFFVAGLILFGLFTWIHHAQRR